VYRTAPLQKVGAGYPLADCAICIAEVAAGEAAPSCPLSRCAVVDEEAAVAAWCPRGL